MLFCILLQSCGTNPFNLDQAQRQAIEAQVDQQRQAPKQPRPKRRPQAPSPTEEAEVLLAPVADTPTQSLAKQPSSPGSGLECQSSAVPKPRQAAGSSSRQAQRMSRPPGQRKGPPKTRAASQQQPHPPHALVAPVEKPAQRQPAVAQAAQKAQAAQGVLPPLSFTASDGQRVVFKQVDEHKCRPQ